MLNRDLFRHRMEFARAIDLKQFEITPNGILFKKQKALVAGQFTTWINGEDMQVDPNVVPIESLNYLLKAALKGTGAIANWFIAPFLNDLEPDSTITAADFDTDLGEFTQYDETTRRAYTLPADPTAGAFTNSAAPAVFTGAAAIVGTVNIFGAGILSQSAKESTAGTIFCASRFAASRPIDTGSKLTVQYDVAATSA